MTTKRERDRSEVEAAIVAEARRLLVSEGPHAVTLRAIAGSLGLTAPALYRYFPSRDAMIRRICVDSCRELNRSLHDAVASITGPVDRVLTLCRAFRGWAAAHPEEYALVFTTPGPGSYAVWTALTADEVVADDPLTDVFLQVVGEVLLADAPGRRRPEDEALEIPDELVGELTVARDAIVQALAGRGLDVSAADVTLADMQWILYWWVRVYGHVTLEVYGRFPFLDAGADALFESLLTELATGLADRVGRW